MGHDGVCQFVCDGGLNLSRFHSVDDDLGEIIIGDADTTGTSILTVRVVACEVLVLDFAAREQQYGKTCRPILSGDLRQPNLDLIVDLFGEFRDKPRVFIVHRQEEVKMLRTENLKTAIECGVQSFEPLEDGFIPCCGASV